MRCCAGRATRVAFAVYKRCRGVQLTEAMDLLQRDLDSLGYVRGTRGWEAKEEAQNCGGVGGGVDGGTDAAVALETVNASDLDGV